MTNRSAGHPFLSFLNTVEDDGKSRDQNSFTGGEGLVQILLAEGLAPVGATAPGKGQTKLILSFREAGYAVFSAIAAGQKPGREDMLLLETAIKSTLQDAHLSLSSEGLALTPGPLGGLYEHLALSAFDAMNSADLSRLRECKRCTHLFLDHGRGSGRRWCSMARCGNRSKAESFRARQNLG